MQENNLSTHPHIKIIRETGPSRVFRTSLETKKY